MLALVLSLAAAQSGGPAREAQVLELVRELERDGSGLYPFAYFARVAPVFGSGAAFEARAFLSCGNADMGSFDDEAARALVRRLGAVYGLDLEPDVERLIGHGRAVLDGFDAAAGVGFELRGRRGSEREALDEPFEDTLDEFEARVLAGQGVRVRVDDARRYRNWLGSTFPAQVAYLAGVVAFLNEVTEGEDVELGGLLFEREARWLPAELDTSGARITKLGGAEYSPGAHLFRVEEPGTLLLACPGRAALFVVEDPTFGGSLVPLAASERTWSGDRRAGPSVLHLDLLCQPLEDEPDLWTGLPDFVLRLRQARAGHEHSVAATPGHDTLFLPSTIDLAEPFTLELELVPGVYRIDEARLGVSAIPASSATQR